MMGGGLPVDFIEAQRTAAASAAESGIGTFEEAVRRAGVSSKSG